MTTPAQLQQIVAQVAAQLGPPSIGEGFPNPVATLFQAGNTVEINQLGLFVYSGAPALGNLIGSWAPAAGTDAFGNAFPQGLDVAVGTITGSTVTGPDYIINSSGIFLYSSTPANGNLLISIAQSSGSDAFGNTYSAGITTSGGFIVQNSQGFFVYGSAGEQSVTLTSGTSWTPPAGLATVKAEAWAGGGCGTGSPGIGGLGGGGGEYSCEPALAIGTPVAYAIGAGGTTGNGGSTTITGSSVTVTANGGQGSSTVSGCVSTGSGAGKGDPGGTGSTNSIHASGGAGGSPTCGGAKGGGGGGASGGPAGAGGPGGGTSGTTAGAGGTALAGGGNGGAGGTSAGTGHNGSAPGGGGGGAGTSGTTQGNGAAGQVRFTYPSTSVTLLASIAPAAGTDAFGNAFPAGIAGIQLGIDYAALAPNGTHAALLFGAAGSAADASITRSSAGLLAVSANLAMGSDMITGADTAWVAVSMGASWSNSGGGSPPFQVMRLPLGLGCMLIRGGITSGANSIANAATIATLPSGYYNTTYNQYIPIAFSAGTATWNAANAGHMLQISTAGVMTINGISAAGTVTVDFQAALNLNA